MPIEHISTATLDELAAAIEAGEVSSVELTSACLERARKLQSRLNAFITLDEERALAQARAADQRRGRGESGPLAGIPLAHKDIFCTEGMLTTCGSRMLADFASPYDAAVIERFNEAGAVILGKTNMDEFAMGSSNETSWYGPVRNPWDERLVPGGSSGGSATAVAAGMAPAATGTDTGGSIRQPAALTGITGLKPTYGRVSRYGMVAFASSLDQAGPLARSARDAAVLLQVMAGFDPRDSTSVDEPVPDYLASLEEGLEGVTVGLPAEYFGEGLDAAAGDAVHAARSELERLGARFVDVSLPASSLAVPCYYVLAPAEASSNLSRYDGVRYGFRAEQYTDLVDMYCRTRAEGFGDEVKRRVMVGTYALSAGYYDAYYLKALKLRRLITDDFRRAFEECDIMMGPATPTPAFPIGDKTDDPIAMYLNDIYTIPANLAGLPAISVPGGATAAGLPVGVQFMGRHLDEARVLNVAHRFQQATDWHRRVPPVGDGE